MGQKAARIQRQSHRPGPRISQGELPALHPHLASLVPVKILARDLSIST